MPLTYKPPKINFAYLHIWCLKKVPLVSVLWIKVSYIRKGKVSYRVRLTISSALFRTTAMDQTRIILLFAAFSIGSGLPAKSHRGSHGHPIPPKPRFDGVFDDGHNHEEIGNFISNNSNFAAV